MIVEAIVLPYAAANGPAAELRLDTPFKPSPGPGYLSGSFPGGITTVDGVPVSATVRVLYRPTGYSRDDGVVVAEVQSAPDGTWLVEGLDPSLRYDVVGRLLGKQDVIVSDVSPKTAAGEVSPTNIMQTLFVSAELTMPLEAYRGSLDTFIRDGVILTAGDLVNTGYARTHLGGAAGVNGAGCSVTFSMPVAVGRMRINGYVYGNFKYVFEALVEGEWLEVSRQAGKGSYTTLETYDFNQSASIISNQWRWRIVDWDSAENYYAGELEVYRYV